MKHRSPLQSGPLAAMAEDIEQHADAVMRSDNGVRRAVDALKRWQIDALRKAAGCVKGTIVFRRYTGFERPSSQS